MQLENVYWVKVIFQLMQKHSEKELRTYETFLVKERKPLEHRQAFEKWGRHWSFGWSRASKWFGLMVWWWIEGLGVYTVNDGHRDGYHGGVDSTLPWRRTSFGSGTFLAQTVRADCHRTLKLLFPRWPRSSLQIEKKPCKNGDILNFPIVICRLANDYTMKPKHP